MSIFIFIISAKTDNNTTFELTLIACTILGEHLHLPQIGGDLGKILYYAIQDDCMRIDAWADITVPLLGQTYTKTLRASLELDPCSFVFHVAFEGYSYTKVLLSYAWGMYILIFMSMFKKYRQRCL